MTISKTAKFSTTGNLFPGDESFELNRDDALQLIGALNLHEVELTQCISFNFK